jgi:hypothetical protein
MFDVIPEANSQSTLLWVERQLQNCALNHAQCVKTSFAPSLDFSESSLAGPEYRGYHFLDSELPSPEIHHSKGSTLPTRLLDLGSSNSSIRLWKTPANAQGEYACLSHCWGPHQPLKSETSNIEEFMSHGILWTSLPKTFQDAINFTRKLGLQFLWIDSLCIIQNDSDDWNREAATMASIYQNSVITLSATGSADCHGGLFFERESREVYVLNASSNQNIIVKARIRHWDDKFTPDFEPDSPAKHHEFPLLNRAWAYQERLLAPRVLHFCRTELIWECMEHSICQCSHLTINPTTSPKPAIANAILREQKLEEGIVEGVNPTRQTSWHQVVSVYSSCDLTFEKDRLPALAGLAEQVQQIREGRYLAGLWEDSLVADLTWERSRSTEIRAKNMNSSSPTWSWSAIGGVDFHVHNWDAEATSSPEQLCEVVEVEYTPLNISNPRGQVAHGKLTIRGHVMEMVLRGGKFDFLDINSSSYALDYDISLPGPGYVEEGTTLFCLTVSRIGRTIYSLILRCTDEERQIYERIGIIFCITQVMKLFLNLFPEWRSTNENIGPDSTEMYSLDLHQDQLKGDPDFFTHSMAPGDVYHISSGRWNKALLVNLNAEEAAKAKSHPAVNRVEKKTRPPLNDPKEAKWFLTPQEAENKARGEDFKEFHFGKIVNIV